MKKSKERKRLRKCGGGGGVSYNFESEEAFVEHIRKLCASCWHCDIIDLKKRMLLIDDVRDDYLCSNCKDE